MSALDNITESLRRDRESKPWRAFVNQNPGIAPLVVSYLDGGTRPTDAELGLNHYAHARVQAEDARRALAAPPPGLLRDKPPGWPDFVGYQRVSLGGASYREFTDTQDVLLDIGDYAYAEGISLVGGRNVVIMGGRITATGLQRAAGVGLAVWPRTDASHYYIEGVRIRPDRNADGTWRRTLNDGIATRGPRGKVTIQNCLVGPCAIKEGYTSSQAHADVLQVQADFDGVLRVHLFTGYTEYTGIMESAFLVREQNWHEVNLVATGYAADDLDPLHLDNAVKTRGHTAFGIYDAGLTKTLPGVTLSEFYWAKDPLQSFAGFSPPELGQRAKSGKPAGGDFVVDAMVGPSYVSPGYA